MSFGGSNPPWQKYSMGNQIPSLQSQMGLPNPNLGFQGNQSMFNQNMTMGHQHSNIQPLIPLSGSGNSNNLNFNQPISYPTRGNINQGGYQQQPPNNQNQGQKTCNKTGVVSKIQSDYGFIDEEIFFHKNVCKGTLPKIGDRVYVEATFSTNSAFKWNATRVYLVGGTSGGGSGGGGGGGGAVRGGSAVRNQQTSGGGGNHQRSGGSQFASLTAVPPPNNFERSTGGGGRSARHQVSPPPRRLSPAERHSRRDSRPKDMDDDDRKRRRDDRDKDKDRVKDKRDLSIDKRDHSPARRTSPKRRRTQTRCMVQVPKVTLNLVESDVLELRRRYTNLYVPSDFFFTNIRWSQSFPPNATFSIHKPCSFHIKHRSVENVKENDAILNPPDADYLFSAKVMLMGIPPMSEIYRKCFATAEEKEKDRDEERNFVHPTRLITFLVGLRGKHEPCCIGGPWSKSVDGANPENDPSVLIKTAIRTCKALTGIDLSPCTQWYRFVELYYRRSESIHKGRTIPARVETVVIYLPDVRSCLPTRIEWDGLSASYKQKMEEVIKASESGTDASTSTLSSSSSSKNNESAEKGTSDGAETNGIADSNASVAVGGAGDGVDADAANDKTAVVPKREPTHFSELDPKTMKVGDLRDELEARYLSSKGLKPQLVGRLAKALKSEENDAATPMDEDGENTEDNHTTMDGDELDMTDIVVIDEYDSTKPEEPKPSTEGPTQIDERERRLFEKRYQLPDNPQIIVHPSRTAKGGKFFCHIMSLSILLDYRPEDTKEHSFEVSLFAELFNEMLIRDFGYNIYKALSALPDKPKEVLVDEKDKEKDPKKEDSARSDDEPKEKKVKRDDDNKTTDAAKPKEEAKEKKEMDKEKDKEKPTDATTTADKDKKVVRDKDKEKEKDRSSRRRRDDEADDDTFSIRSGDPRRKDNNKERPKYYTVDPDLLLSFVYFDQTHCGYIFEKDIEDLFYTLGLHLSRAQTRKLIGKVITRDSLLYRKLTDKPKDEKTDGSGTTVAVIGTEIKPTESAEPTEIDYDALSKGNRIYLPIFKATRNDSESVHQSDDNVENGQKCDVVSSETGMVSYKGGLVDIEKLMEQMKRSEKARDETEQLLVDLRKTNAELAAINTRSKDKIKDLQSSLKSSNRKLSDTEQQLSTVNKKSNEYHSILNSIHDRVAPIFAKSTRDRDRKDRNRDDNRDNKEREKDKDDDKDKEKVKCEKDKDADKETEGAEVDVKVENVDCKVESTEMKGEPETN